MNVPDHPVGSENQPKENKQRARRRFVHGVGVAVPVVMTVRSPSALAAQCFAPSAAASIALLSSRLDRETLNCTGRPPGFWGNAWKTHATVWETSGGEGRLFSDVFGGGFPGKSLKKVMALNGNQDQWQLGAHLSAAYLNNKMGWVPDTVMSPQDLRDMWAGKNGTYTPTAGVTWGGEAIVAYLQTTMPL